MELSGENIGSLSKSTQVKLDKTCAMLVLHQTNPSYVALLEFDCISWLSFPGPISTTSRGKNAKPKAKQITKKGPRGPLQLRARTYKSCRGFCIGSGHILSSLQDPVRRRTTTRSRAIRGSLASWTFSCSRLCHNKSARRDSRSFLRSMSTRDPGKSGPKHG